MKHEKNEVFIPSLTVDIIFVEEAMYLSYHKIYDNIHYAVA